jgi:predicted branched-subunit amino acid permease
MNTNWKTWLNGMKNGIPIALGYFAVSFTFGILAKQSGLNPFEAVFMSVTNLTSAGQFAGLTLIASAATLAEVAITQLIINSRYFLMTFALSQKIHPDTPFFHRVTMAFGITDEVFGVSMAQPGRLSPYFTYGVVSIALPGWALGTLFGVISGNILPDRMISALSVALYGMLLAVIIPPAKENKVITGLIIVSMLTSFLFAELPFLQEISSGIKIILLTFLLAGLAAFLFPVKEDSYE